jgi:hypothetical protein
MPSRLGARSYWRVTGELGDFVRRAKAGIIVFDRSAHAAGTNRARPVELRALAWIIDLRRLVNGIGR